jgi:dihydropteroate synthase
MTEAVETRDQAQDLKEEMIEMTEAVKTRDQAQDLKEEMIEMTEAVKTRDQAQDLKEETIEIEEEIIIKMKAEKENLLVLKKNLTERRSLLKRVLEIREKNFQEKKI